jgi:hypothetical protein
MITPSFSLTATERVLPNMALDFTTASLDSRVTFTRTGNTATVVNSSGYVAPINANLPRFDFDPNTLACKGLLIEEARTNRILYSQDFSNVGWAKQNSSVSAAAGTSPDGTNNSYKLIEDTSTTTHQILTSPAVIVTAGTYCVSFYVKPAGRSIIRINDNSNPTNTQAFFSLSGDGSVTSETPAGTGSITLVGNGWYRCTMKTVTAQLTVTPLIRLVNTGTNTVYTGDGSSGVLLWGAQLEAGAFPTSYIPTELLAVTRNADVATMTGTNFSDWFNASEGALEINATAISASQFLAAGALYLDSNNYITLGFGDLNKPRLLVRNAGTFEVNTTSSVAQTSPFNQCVAYKSGSISFASNTTLIVNSVNKNIPSGLTTFYIGTNPAIANSYANAWLTKVNYWPQRLINNEVIAFSK